MSYVERRPLRDRDTKLLTEQQPRGKDTVRARVHDRDGLADRQREGPRDPLRLIW